MAKKAGNVNCLALRNAPNPTIEKVELCHQGKKKSVVFVYVKAFNHYHAFAMEVDSKRITSEIQHVHGKKPTVQLVLDCTRRR